MKLKRAKISKELRENDHIRLRQSSKKSRMMPFRSSGGAIKVARKRRSLGLSLVLPSWDVKIIPYGLRLKHFKAEAIEIVVRCMEITYNSWI